MYTKSEKHLYLIIPAAGQSRRMGNGINKLLTPVAGISVLGRTLLLFEKYAEKENIHIHGLLICSPEHEADFRKEIIRNHISFVESFVHGGTTRQNSVFGGIQKLQLLKRPPTESDIIFIHDGARCLTNPETLIACYHAAKKHGICAAAVPVKDTIKEIASPESRMAKKTPDRRLLFAIQTPQAFTWKHLQKTFQYAQKNGIEGTDDTSLAEAAGLPVYLAEGAYTNIKITTKEDFVLAEAIIKQDAENCSSKRP